MGAVLLFSLTLDPPCGREAGGLHILAVNWALSGNSDEGLPIRTPLIENIQCRYGHFPVPKTLCDWRQPCEGAREPLRNTEGDVGWVMESSGLWPCYEFWQLWY